MTSAEQLTAPWTDARTDSHHVFRVWSSECFRCADVAADVFGRQEYSGLS